MQMHEKPLALALDRELIEQVGRDQCFERGVACGFIKPAVGRGMKIRPHGCDIDALVAFDVNQRARALLVIAVLVFAGAWLVVPARCR